MLGDIRVKRYGSELPLFTVAVLFSLLCWGLIIISMIGLFYAFLFSIILFAGHIVAVTLIRGSGIKVSAEQFPELHHCIENLSKRIGLKKTPEVYIVQGNGVLNAMATKFVCTKMIVIYSNLLDACENNLNARDMVIGHELGHLKAGHLRWKWLTWPALIIPFLGSAYSRACEYTADKYGVACANNKQDAIKGLVILASGKNLADKVNLDLFASQLKEINTGCMRFGEWMSSHPTIVRRICALEPDLKIKNNEDGTWSVVKGMGVVVCSTLLIAVCTMSFSIFMAIVDKKLSHRTYVASQETNQEYNNEKIA